MDCGHWCEHAFLFATRNSDVRNAIFEPLPSDASVYMFCRDSARLMRQSSVSDMITSPSHSADKSVEKLAKLTGEVIFSPAGQSLI